MAGDNSGHQCARCERASRGKLISPPQVPAEFWQTEQFRQAFAAQHIGRVSRAYRTHPLMTGRWALMFSRSWLTRLLA